MTRIKICGITNEDDARWAEQCGADALGFVFADSPRRVAHAQAAEIIRCLGPLVTPVGVLVDPSAQDLEKAVQCGVRAVQIHGPSYLHLPELPPLLPVIRVVRVHDRADVEVIGTLAPKASAVLLDTHVEGVEGGTGRTFDWNLAVSATGYGVPIILAGGLAQDNVGEAIRRLRPYGVDASSRLESAPGVKDRESVSRFIMAVRAADVALD